jgi:hypothetical protein
VQLLLFYDSRKNKKASLSNSLSSRTFSKNEFENRANAVAVQVDGFMDNGYGRSNFLAELVVETFNFDSINEHVCTAHLK